LIFIIESFSDSFDKFVGNRFIFESCSKHHIFGFFVRYVTVCLPYKSLGGSFHGFDLHVGYDDVIGTQLVNLITSHDESAMSCVCVGQDFQFPNTSLLPLCSIVAEHLAAVDKQANLIFFTCRRVIQLRQRDQW